MIRIDDELTFDFYISRHSFSIALLCEKCKYLFPFPSYPVLRLYIYSIRSDLPDLARLETIGGEISAKATPRIDTDSIRAYPQSICRPVTIDDELGTRIALVPGSSLDDTDHRRDLSRCIDPIARMETSMYEDEFFSFYTSRE
jgi:hypothetical protein